MPAQTVSTTLSLKTIAPEGFSQWEQIKGYVPFCRETFRKMVKAGKAPAPMRLSERCTVYSNRELHTFFADPLNYRAPVSGF